MYYAEMTLLTILASVVITLIIFKNSLLPTSKKRSMMRLYLLLIVSAICEWLGVFLDGSPDCTVLLHGAVKALEYSLIPYLYIQMANIMGAAKPSKWSLILVGANAVFQFSSIATGLSFCIDDANICKSGSLSWIYTVVWLFCGIYAVLECFKYGSRFQSGSKLVSLALISLPIVGIVLKQLNDDAMIEMPCITLTSIFLYVYYEDILQKSDPLTGLLNRGSYIGQTANISEKAVIIYFDIDEFKQINDKYGHSYGDKVLCAVGRIIKEVYSKYGWCYRVGGDEFCVILKQNTENVEALNARFRAALAEFQASSPHLLTVSLGHSTFDPQKDDFEKVVQLADKNMYRTKSKLRMALRESNAKLFATVRAFQIAAQVTSALVFIYEIKEQRIIVDEVTAKAFGVKEVQDGIPYQTAKMGIITEDTVDEYIRIHEEIIHGAPKSGGIVKLIQADGTQSTQELSFIAVLGEGGQPTGTAVGVYTTVHD